MKGDFINYYKILNVRNNATIDEIKKSYKNLVLSKHPDINKESGSDEIFKKIIEAYTILKNPLKRSEYDKELSDNKNIFSKINFKYDYKKVINKKDKIFGKLSVFFKNLKNKNIVFEDEDNINNLSKDIVEMSIEDLEMRLMISENVYVRYNAALALGLKRDKRAHIILEQSLKDNELEVRAGVVWALGNLGMKKVLPQLRKMYYNSGILLKKEIIKAVYKITNGKGGCFKELVEDILKSNDEELKNFYNNIIIKKNKKTPGFINNMINNGSEKIKTYLEKISVENSILEV